MKLRTLVRSLLCCALIFIAVTPILAQQQVTPFGQNSVVMNQVTTPIMTPTGAGATTCHPPVAPGNVCEIQTLGQNMHYLNYTTTGTSVVIDLRLEGSIDGTNFFPISADASDPNGTLCAVGYYPVIRANLVQITGSTPTLTASYAGTSAASGCGYGTYNPSQQQTRIVVLSNGSISTNTIFAVPAAYGNSYGTMFVSSSSATSGASVVANTFGPNFGQAGAGLGTVSLNTGVTGTYIPLAAFPTSQIQINVFPNSGSITNLSIEIVFSPPPFDQSNQFTNITTNTNTMIKRTAANAATGVLVSVVINAVGSSDATATLFDGVIGGGVCTGTKIGTLNVGSAVGAVPYLVQFKSGLCITTAGTTPGDYTAVWR